MSMKQNKGQLINKCNELGIAIDPDKKYKNIDFIKLLGNYFFNLLPESKKTWGLQRRMEIDTPMLLERYTYLKEKEQQELFNSKDWIAEPKVNGTRCCIFYTPAEGFTFISRNYSEVNYLPVDFTENVLLIKKLENNEISNNKQAESSLFSLPIKYNVTNLNSENVTIEKIKDKIIQIGSHFINKFNFPFILDAEIVLTGNIDTTNVKKYGTVTSSEQNATTAVLQMLTPESHQVQIEQFPFEFYIFDCLYYKEWLLDKTLQNRKFIQEAIVTKLTQEFPLPFKNVTRYITKEEKENAWEWQLNNRGEGLAFKNLTKPYHAKENRQKDTCIKLKRSMQLMAERNDMTDIDAFITGYTLPESNSKYNDYIGGVKFSVVLKKKNDTEVEHYFATVSGIDLELRRAMSYKEENGLPALKEEYYGKVCQIDGMSVTKNLLLAHARSRFNFRQDKSKFECILDEQFLLDNLI